MKNASSELKKFLDRKAFNKKRMRVSWPVIPSYATFNIFGKSFPKKK